MTSVLESVGDFWESEIRDDVKHVKEFKELKHQQLYQPDFTRSYRHKTLGIVRNIIIGLQKSAQCFCTCFIAKRCNDSSVNKWIELEVICSYSSPVTISVGSIQNGRYCRHIILQEETHQQKWNCQACDYRGWYSAGRRDERAAVEIVRRCVNELQASFSHIFINVR